MESRLKGKVVIVTGASSGIGYGSTLRLAKEGAKVVLAARSADKLEAAAQEISKETGAESLVVPTDVSDIAAIKALVDQAVKKFGKVDAAFLNAGGFSACSYEDMEEDAFNNMFNLNVKSVAFGIKYTMAAMKQTGTKGSIVVNSSVMGVKVTAKAAGSALYSASKAAVDRLVQYAAVEAAEHGIRVNAIQPGIVRTNVLPVDDDAYDAFAKDMQLIGRAGRAHEIAGLVAYLASDESTFMNGSLVPIDGGWNLKA